MTTQQRLESHERQLAHLTKISAEALESIQALTRTVRAMGEENLKAAEENNRFRTAVRGAVESLAKSAAKNAKAIASLERQFQAYLSSRPPQ